MSNYDKTLLYDLSPFGLKTYVIISSSSKLFKCSFTLKLQIQCKVLMFSSKSNIQVMRKC